MNSKTAISVNNLSKEYLVYDKPQDRLKQSVFGKIFGKRYFNQFAALKDVSLELKKGESLGIVGRNGSGKSTLLQLICGTLFPTNGDVKVNGRISALLELGAGFNPEFTGKENVFLNASILGLSRAEIEKKYDKIIAFADIGDHINQPVKTYSSGMYVRLAFAVAVATDPDILIVDEALAVGDLAFQRKCFARISQMKEAGTTILFVSHSINNVIEICDRSILLDSGELILSGSPRKVISHYQRLMFASEKNAPIIREEIKSLGEQHNDEEEKEESQLNEQLDPDMKPESSVEYKPSGAVISNPRITTQEGKEVNVLVRGRKYIYKYDVKFSKNLENVRFGMGIKTKSGTILGGATTHIGSDKLDIKKGKEVEVSFTFTCLLREGVYFTNSGCSAVIGDKREHVHRVMDAHMFRIQPEGETKEKGMVDFLVTSQVDYKN